jgi:hypothetical protein
LAASSIFSTTFVGVGTYSMSGTVFADVGAVSTSAATADPDDAGVADAVVGVALALATGVAAVALGDAEFEVPELAGAPVPVDVPEGVQAAAARARRPRPSESNEREVVMPRAWDDTTEGGVKRRLNVTIEGRNGRSVVRTPHAATTGSGGGSSDHA